MLFTTLNSSWLQPSIIQYAQKYTVPTFDRALHEKCLNGDNVYHFLPYWPNDLSFSQCCYINATNLIGKQFECLELEKSKRMCHQEKFSETSESVSVLKWYEISSNILFWDSYFLVMRSSTDKAIKISFFQKRVH